MSFPVDTDDDEGTTDNESDVDEDEESSVASADAEERAYLRQIQQTATTPVHSTSPVTRNDIKQMAGSPSSAQRVGTRAPSVASTQSMVTALTRRPSGTSSITMISGTSHIRPPSSTSVRSAIDRRQYLAAQGERTPLRVLPRESFLEENFDDSVNPWVHHPSSRRYNIVEGRSTAQNEEHNHHEVGSRGNSVTTPQNQQVLSPQLAGQSSSRFQSPMFSSTSSSATATARTAVPRMSLNDFGPVQQQQQGRLQQLENRPLSDQQYTSVVALGPATKRALEALQAEIIALNERIDGLRQELVDRDQRRPSTKQPHPLRTSRDRRLGDEDGSWEGWWWVFKAAGKHAAAHILTALILFAILYQRGSPIAYVILGQIHKYLLRSKSRISVKAAM
ncbi:hypothetical protein EC973_002204 [Apophysomyces ossiformis]|uniref:Uncharacterized protein n=1 Tax=Apophysomyces ossiformis TaxID=679940 RepID=A0A8H7BR90_9FUNG|nr:hypothetical protein EC973_002204 [Apophysomyces ossiformis]